MKLINPTGQKTIHLQDRDLVRITLEDREPGSREFDLEVYMDSDEAQCEIIGRIQTQGNDRKKWKIRQIFAHENQKGTIDLKGSAEKESYLEFDGSALIDSASRNAEVSVSERVILFDSAQGKVLPILTVKTDQVKKASHAAFIAPINPEKILYAASRGLDNEAAINLIKKGFLYSE